MKITEIVKTKTFWSAVAFGVVSALAGQGIIEPATAETLKGIIAAVFGAAVRAAIQKNGPKTETEGGNAP